ncbi:MAG: HAMP domain-containing histidine kinase [Bdellovibrionales bacterium]|nr:HAMP domain-containing histidine kinase [Bdellovibrionales bacterium]
MKKFFEKLRTEKKNQEALSSSLSPKQPYRLDKYVEPIDYFISIVFGVGIVLLVLRPTFLQTLAIFALDSVFFTIFLKLDLWYFRTFQPGSELIHPTPIWRQLSDQILEEKKEEISSSFERFLKLRLRFMIALNICKAFPSVVFGLYLISPEKLTLANIGFTHLALFPLHLFYAAATYLNCIRIFNRERKELSRRVTLVSLVENTAPTFFSSINITLLSLLLSTVGLQLVVAYSQVTVLPSEQSAFWLAINSGAMCFILALRLWFQAQTTFEGQLNEIIAEIRSRGLSSTGIPVETPSIDTFHSLASEINHLFKRISQNEIDLTEANFRRADAVKFETLGEITALVAHDLSGPLHAVRFYSDEISEKSDDPVIKNLSTKARLNSDRAVELLHALKLRVRNPNPSAGEKSISVLEAHQMVVTLLETQFRGSTLDKIKFEFEPALASVYCSLATTDLLHVLDNIYRNSVTHFIRDCGGAGTVFTRIAQQNSNSKVVLAIADDGHGLSVRDFEEKIESGRGLGLKLTKRLIEKSGGTFGLLTDSATPGTTFILELPLAQTTGKQGTNPVLEIENR